MLTHVHKVIHSVVGTFERGLETLPVECPTVPPAPCTKKTGFHRVHRTLVSTGPERPISGNSEDAGVGLRPDVDGVLKALVWFWLIDETLSANLVYQNNYEIGSTTLSDEAIMKIMTMMMTWWWSNAWTGKRRKRKTKGSRQRENCRSHFVLVIDTLSECDHI